jgi:hypothetical protein
MFTFDATIDAVQNGKKQFVNTFVTNQAIKDTLVEFVDAQTAYTKSALKAGTDSATTIAKELTKSISEAAKFDYTKFGEGVMKAYNSLNKTAK